MVDNFVSTTTEQLSSVGCSSFVSPPGRYRRLSDRARCIFSTEEMVVIKLKVINLF